MVVNTQGRESGGSGFDTCSGVWYPRRRPCVVAINTLFDLNKLAGESPSFTFTITSLQQKNGFIINHYYVSYYTLLTLLLHPFTYYYDSIITHYYRNIRVIVTYH